MAALNRADAPRGTAVALPIPGHVPGPRVPGRIAYATRVGPCAVALTSRQALLDVLRSLEGSVRGLQRTATPTPARVADFMTLLQAAIDEWDVASGFGNTELPSADLLPTSSIPNDLIDAAETARLLGVSARQARNLALQLGGHKVAGSWWFDRLTVLAEVDRRQEDT